MCTDSVIVTFSFMAYSDYVMRRTGESNPAKPGKRIMKQKNSSKNVKRKSSACRAPFAPAVPVSVPLA